MTVAGKGLNQLKDTFHPGLLTFLPFQSCICGHVSNFHFHSWIVLVVVCSSANTNNYYWAYYIRVWLLFLICETSYFLNLRTVMICVVTLTQFLMYYGFWSTQMCLGVYVP
jgi:hypothetical protein